MLTTKIGLASSRAFSGQEIGFFVRFILEPGWHIYGAPLPSGYTATTVSFDDAHVAHQSFRMPEADQVQIPVLGEIVPVYRGAFEGLGTLLLKHPLPQAGIVLKGRLDLQKCSDTVCEPPVSILFDLPLKLEPFAISDRERKLLEQQGARA
jgi:hypothetical protein